MIRGPTSTRTTCDCTIWQRWRLGFIKPGLALCRHYAGPVYSMIRNPSPGSFAIWSLGPSSLAVEHASRQLDLSCLVRPSCAV